MDYTPYGLLTAHIHYLRCHRRKFEPRNLVLHVPLLMTFLKSLPSVFLAPDQGTFLYPAQVPVLCHISPGSSWHLFLQRQGLQPAHNQKPPAPPLSFHGNVDCPAVLVCQSFDWRLCSSQLQPSPELAVAPGCAEQSALGRLSESSPSSLLSPCSQHATVIRLPLLPAYVQRTFGAELGACTERGQ